VTSIGSYAFYECTSLASITIPSSVTSIGEVTFYYCTSLASITIPSSVTSIGFGAFYDCDKLTIYGYAGSYAETYANENSIPFVEIQPIAIKGTSLILDGSIGIKTYLDIEEGYGASTTVKSVVYDTNRFNTISEDILTPVYDAEKELYYVMTYISPKDVDNTEVRNTLICGSVTLVGEPISISNYIADFKEIAKTDEELAKGLGVVEAIETYTKYADNFFSDTNALEDIACDTSALDKIAAPEKSGTLSGIKHISTALILEGNTTIRHYFEVADGKYTFEVGGEVIEATELGDGIIYVDIADIPAHNLDEIYTLTVNDTMIINFSALNYVKLALTSENSKLSNLVKALYNYWQSTEKYVNQI